MTMKHSPMDRLRHHVTGAIERGEAVAITEQRAKHSPGRTGQGATVRLYKLTDANGRTHNNTQWGKGVSHSGTGEGPLCGPGWIHAYPHPLLAVLLNPIHADFANPLLWEAEGVVAIRDNDFKVGCLTLTTVQRVPLPAVSTEQRVKFAILCAKEVCENAAWNAWADAWLSEENRSTDAAARAAAAAMWAADAAAMSARAARAARAADAAAVWAADAAARAARAAAVWAARAAMSARGVDLVALANRAMQP